MPVSIEARVSRTEISQERIRHEREPASPPPSPFARPIPLSPRRPSLGIPSPLSFSSFFLPFRGSLSSFFAAVRLIVPKTGGSRVARHFAPSPVPPSDIRSRRCRFPAKVPKGVEPGETSERSRGNKQGSMFYVAGAMSTRVCRRFPKPARFRDNTSIAARGTKRPGDVNRAGLGAEDWLQAGYTSASLFTCCRLP